MTTDLPTFEDINKIAKDTYRSAFNVDAEIVCCAPGRVNLIGEHIDYNDGFVLPMALSLGTIIVGGKCEGDEVEILTCCPDTNTPDRHKFSVKGMKPGQPKWANYIKGVINGFGHTVPAFTAAIATNVPIGAGLSSSAALEVATVKFLEQLTGHTIESDKKRALICQDAEHKYVGMPCGIMDQMISVCGKKNHALLLDCRNMETFQIPFQADQKDIVVLICNSGVRHELSESEYPARRKQCAQALEIMNLKSYRDATEANLSALSESDEVLLRRARHVITEIKRTQDAAAALKDHNFEKMGELMTKSHISLRDDFQVSCTELDALVDAAINCPGVLGSRMTGGGFGGCTVTLLKRTAVKEAITTMRENFIKKFNQDDEKNLEFYVCKPDDGARQIV